MKRLNMNNEKPDDFILAILTDANGTYQGRSHLEYCFEKMDLRQTFCDLSKGDRTVFFELYQILLDDGADAGVLIRKRAEEFAYLQKATVECLRLISVLLLSEQVKYNSDYKSQFDVLFETVATLLCQIEQADFITDKPDTEEVPDDNREWDVNDGLEWDVVRNYVNCMRSIYKLNTQPWRILKSLIKAVADVSLIFEEGIVSDWKLEHLFETATDAIRLIRETMRGKNAISAIKESTAITDNFSELNELLKEIIFRKEGV